MARKELEPRWLVGLLNQWARYDAKQLDKGLGFPSTCPMLRDGIPVRARSYEPTGYGDADMRDVHQAVERLNIRYRCAVMRYYRPWSRQAIDGEWGAVHANVWAKWLHEAMREMESDLVRLRDAA